MKVELTDVSFRAGGNNILGPVNLLHASGECCVLLGPNGAGKSTLMRVASGYLTPTCGGARLNDRQVADISMNERARMLGVLTQRSSLDFPFRAEEVIAMGRTPYGADTAPDDITATVMELLGIRGDRIYTSLSGGEKQLVQLARIFVQVWGSGPEAVLLLDEPMTALDLNHQREVVALLRRFSQEGTGQMIVMHDINMAAEVADKIILMSDGLIVAAGKPEEVLQPDTLEATFGIPMQLLRDGEERFYKASL